MSINLDDVKKNKTKIRLSTWWWGRYVIWTGTRWVDESGFTLPAAHVDETYVVYDEEKDGEHNENECISADGSNSGN